MQMEMITDVQIDLYGEMQFYKASAKQGDKATRYLRIQLMNNGNEFQIPDGVILLANIKKPDGKFCYNECVKRENRVMVQLTNQALAAAGTAYCDIEMRDENGELILSSAVFTIEIEQSMRDERAMESSNEMTFIDSKFETMKAIQKKVEEMKAAVEKTKEQVDKAYNDITNGAASTLIGNNLTANRAVVSDADGKVAVSKVTDTELECLDGVKSNIQGQFDNIKQEKLAKTGDSANNTVTFSSGDAASPTGWADVDVAVSGEKHSSLFRKLSLAVKNVRYIYKLLTSGAISTLLGTNLTANRAVLSNGSGKLAVSAVTSTELGYLTGAKSKIQSQLDELNTGLSGKAPSGHTHDDRYYTKTEVSAGMAGKADSGHTHTKSQITDFPASLPASDVYAWAKAKSKPSYSWSEITGKPGTFAPSSHTHAAGQTSLNKTLYRYLPNAVMGISYDNVGGYLDDVSDSIKNLADGKADNGSCLPLTGGTVSGSVTFSTGPVKFGTMSISCENNGYTFLGNASIDNAVGLIFALAPYEKAFYPNVDKSMSLGVSSRRWTQIYANNSTISTSDRTVKKDISAIPDQYLQLFALLQPVTYRFIDGQSGRIHVGFIAQDVEAAMEQVGLSDLDFAGFCKDTTNDGDTIYSLRYEEFIALNTAVIQHQQQKISSLEERVAKLENYLTFMTETP